METMISAQARSRLPCWTNGTCKVEQVAALLLLMKLALVVDNQPVSY